MKVLNSLGLLDEIAARGALFNLGYIVVIVSVLILGLLIYSRDKKSSTNKTFLVLTTSLLLWTIFNYLADIHISYRTNLYLGRIAHAAGFLAASSFFHFCLIFPKKKGFMPWYDKLGAFISLWFMAITIFTGLIYKKIWYYKLGINAVDGLLAIHSAIWLAILALGGTAIIIYKLLKSKGKERNQLEYLFLGTFLFILYVFPMSLIIPLMREADSSTRFGPFGLLPFVGFIAYGIVKHRLMDIRAVILKSVVYTFLVAIIGGLYVFLVYYLKRYYESIINPDIAFILAGFIIALGFQPLKKALERSTRIKYSPKKATTSRNF